MESANDFETASLAPGTRVGPWCVEAPRGRGCYGTVYRALRVGQEKQGPFALKLALRPDDARFAREVELLARVRHPAVPRLHDSGHWRHPSGARYPYVVMQWVEGTSLYDWAEPRALSSRQLMRLFAQLARALEATHAAGGVHRDVKGDNVLVGRDGRVFLTDFGAGHYQGAATLTGRALPPGTPAYRAPEAWRFALTAAPGEHYCAGPADDLFALGVIAWRLVVGRYPPPTHPADDAAYIWRPGGMGPLAPGDANTRCDPELSALILRLLSLNPEARGSARQLAESLEERERHAGPAADTPLWSWPAPPPKQPPALPLPVALPSPTPPKAPRRSWRVAASVVLALAVGALSQRPELYALWGRGLQRLTPELVNDGGTATVADAAVADPRRSVPPRPTKERIAWEMPSKPFPRQVRPDAQGRCSRKREASIHGGCWLPLKVTLEECKDYGYEYKGECYLPVIPPARPPVSNSATEDPQP